MSRKVTISELRSIPLFSSLSDEVLERIASCAGRVSFAASDVILTEGRENDRLFCLLSGRLQVSRGSGPTDVVLSELRAGSVLGELTFIEPGAATATATALEAGEAVVLSAAAFSEVEREQPAAALALLRRLALTLKERLAEANALLLTHKGIHDAFSEVEELRLSLGQLI
jgi:CRP-like cAMP-binding protein